MTDQAAPPRIALFSSCLVDLLRPEAGAASIKLLSACGYEVEVPRQSCCGQPNYNAGDVQGAARLAKQWVNTFSSYAAIVVPSGSCAATVIKDYPALFSRLGEPEWARRATDCANKTSELLSFLDKHIEQLPPLRCDIRASYHDSCSGLRKLGIKGAGRRLLAQVSGLDLVELDAPEVCCGFGGAFCVKQPEISTAMADDKLDDAERQEAEVLLGGDWGCLMHLLGRASMRAENAEAKALACAHVVELLADSMGR